MTTSAPDPRSRLFPPGIVVASTLAGAGLQYLLPLRLLPQPAGRFIGAALILAWLILVAFAMGVFRRAGTTPYPRGEVTALVTTGLYRFSRNPMYVGLVLLQIGIACVLGNAWVLMLTLLSFVLLDRIVIAGEERYLEGKCGSEYSEYRGRVRRWL